MVVDTSALLAVSFRGGRQLDQLLHTLNVTTIPIDLDQVAAARTGFRKYGKGRPRAGLNFGDCFAYGLAVALDAPLLFKGADFAKTDVRNALE